MDQRLTNIVTQLRQRPGLYIGSPSVVRLRTFLDGYFCALIQANVIDSIPIELQEFREFVYRRYPMMDPPSWADLLVSIAGNDESGFQLFEQLWSEFESDHQG